MSLGLSVVVSVVYLLVLCVFVFCVFGVSGCVLGWGGEVVYVVCVVLGV